jgi:signal transduction histidine kinase
MTMRARPRRGVLGLRGRIVGLVLFTTAATLAVAALTLLGPLESNLRNSARVTLEHDVRTASINNSSLSGLDLTHVLDYIAGNPEDPYYRQGSAEWVALQRELTTLDSRLGGTAVLLGFPGPDGQGTIVAPLASSGETSPYDDVAKLLFAWDNLRRRQPRLQSSLGTDQDGTEVARVAYPITIGGVHYVLAIRRSISEIPAAVAAVRTAFLTAALAGFGLTLILGIPLAATLVRRLRRLRQAALKLAREGPGVAVPADRARDEVGDLARTFATMQRQLQQQEEARRAFVATASHELRTPLASLDGMLELLHDDLHEGDPDLDEARTLLARARVQSRRLARLASDLLDLSRLDADVKLRSEPLELGELSRAVLAEFELGTAERGVSTALEVADGQVWSLGDPGSVARILRILLDNAVRHSPAGTEITVELHNGASAELSVSDQGPGVPSEDRTIIFERFQRGRETAGIAGFGLGLAIGRELATRMGGQLLLDEDYAPGAMFTLRLPMAHEHEVKELSVS